MADPNHRRPDGTYHDRSPGAILSAVQDIATKVQPGSVEQAQQVPAVPSAVPQPAWMTAGAGTFREPSWAQQGPQTDSPHIQQGPLAGTSGPVFLSQGQAAHQQAPTM